MASPPLLRRHLLLWLSQQAWSQLIADPLHDETARACFARWASDALPVVATRQSAMGSGRVDAGLPAPLAFGRRKIALQVDAAGIVRTGSFPSIAHCDLGLAGPPVEAWGEVCRALQRLDCEARVFGSRAWQAITRHGYVTAASDIDLIVPVRSARHADAACAVLAGWPHRVPRLDAELLFQGDGAVHWQEWQRCRSGEAGDARVLVKRLDGVALRKVDDIAPEPR